jgi:hypothetical protein
MDGTINYPKVYLVNRGRWKDNGELRKIGEIYPINDLSIEVKFSEANTCSFTIYQNMDIENLLDLDNEQYGRINTKMPLFDRVKNLSIVLIEGFGLFEIKVSLSEKDAISKKITGTSLQESELGQWDITLEVNTEDDIARTTYDADYPTVFYRDLSEYTEGTTDYTKRYESSLIHRILTYAPLYSIGHIDESLWGINRQFSCSDSTVYDFLQDVAEEVGCVFIFDKYTRTINAYDIQDHCTQSGCSGRQVVNGVCQECNSSQYIEQGYGLDTSLYVDTSTIVQSIEDSVDTNSVKNCIKIKGGDDETTNRIGQRLIGGSNYLWNFGEDTLEEFSDELREKWEAYSGFVLLYQSKFDDAWDRYNDAVNKQLYLESGKMPDTEYNTVNITDSSCEEQFDIIKEKIPYWVIGSKNTVESSITSKILKYANFVVNDGFAVELDPNKEVKTTTEEDGNFTVITSWSGYLHIYFLDCVDESGNNKYEFYNDKNQPWTLEVKHGYNQTTTTAGGSTIFTNEYYEFLNQQLKYKLASTDITYEPKFDTEYDDGKNVKIYKQATAPSSKKINDYWYNPTDTVYYQWNGSKWILIGGDLTANWNTDGTEWTINRSYIPNYGTDSGYYTKYFSEYGINRLQSFLTAYEQCSTILYNENSSLSDTQQAYNYIVDENGTVSDVTILEALLNKYETFHDVIERYIKFAEAERDIQVSIQNKALSEINDINKVCNLHTYLGDELYNELLSFKREQVYENSNFTSDVTDESVLMSNIEELIVDAKMELVTNCEFQHDVPISMANLLTLTNYSNFFDIFAVGNYMRAKINDSIVKMRIVSIPFNFESPESSEVTFSDALVGNQATKVYQKTLQKASSMATSFDYVQKQTVANDTHISTFNKMFNEGITATTTLLANADNQSTIMDRYGILTRRYDEDTGEYDDFQMRVTNSTIGFTTDNWKTIKSAFGKYWWNDEWRYGLLAESIVGKFIASESLQISNSAGSVIIDENGITLDGGKITWTNKGVTDSITIYYATSNSSTTPPAENDEAWKTQFTGTLNNNYLWSKTVTTYTSSDQDDSVEYHCLGNSPDGIKATTKEYILWTSDENEPNEDNEKWSTIQPTWISGNYVWTRNKVTYISNDTTYVDVAYDEGLTKSLQNFTDFKSTVNSSLNTIDSALAVTTVGTDYIISPKIGGGYLYITNNNYSVEIDPNHSANENTLDKYLICVRKKDSNDRIFSVDTSGNGYFKASIIATSGSIGGFTISSTADTTTHLYKNSLYYSSTNTINGTKYDYEFGLRGVDDNNEQKTTQKRLLYVRRKLASTTTWSGDDDTLCEPLFYVTNYGKLYAKNAIIEGAITATSLKLDGCTVSTDKITGLSTVATSGDYSDLTGTPEIPSDIADLTDNNKKFDTIVYKGDITSETGKDNNNNNYIKYTVPSSSGNLTYTIYDTDNYILTNVGVGTGTISADDASENTSTDTYVCIAKDGLLTANNAVIRGSIYATDGYFSGELKAATGTFSGKLSAATGSFSGKITAKSGEIGDFTISSTADETSHLYKNSLYCQTTNGDYDYEFGLRGYKSTGERRLLYVRRKLTGTKLWDGDDDTLCEPLFYVTNYGKLYAKNAIIKGAITCGDNFAVTTDGNLTAQSGTIGGFEISDKGLSNTSNAAIGAYITSISKYTDYSIDVYDSCSSKTTHYFQTTINNGKIVCGISCPDSPSLSTPDITGGYVDVSAKGIYSKCFGAYYGASRGYLFAADTQNSAITMNGTVTINGTVSSNSTSDRKKKHNIENINAEWTIEFINKLQPSTYQYNDSIYNKTHYGMIAQDVEKTMLDMGMDRLDFSGLVKTPKEYDGTMEEVPDDYDFDKDDEEYNYYLRYDDFIAPIIKYCQELYKQNQTFSQELDELRQQIKEILQ